MIITLKAREMREGILGLFLVFSFLALTDRFTSSLKQQPFSLLNYTEQQQHLRQEDDIPWKGRRKRGEFIVDE